MAVATSSTHSTIDSQLKVGFQSRGDSMRKTSGRARPLTVRTATSGWGEVGTESAFSDTSLPVLSCLVARSVQ